MPREGLAPSRGFPHKILSLARLLSFATAAKEKKVQAGINFAISEIPGIALVKRSLCSLTQEAIPRKRRRRFRPTITVLFPICLKFQTKCRNFRNKSQSRSNFWRRRRRDLHPRMGVLQTPVLATSPRRQKFGRDRQLRFHFPRDCFH